ncbi:MAG TPA: EF-hand domain-containing protein [Sphingobium sp.]|nr:EF-hand domain-containing protein [Sphingobium sp.]
MIRAMMVSTALLIAMPALAQETASPASAGQTARPSGTANTVASIVDSEFPAYDGNNDGQLDKAEFARWMVALKDQEMKTSGKTLAPAEVTAWADGAFTTADADKSVSVSKPELISYLSGGAG